MQGTILGPKRVIRYTKADKANVYGDWYTVPYEVMVYYVIVDQELVPCESIEAARKLLGVRS